MKKSKYRIQILSFFFIIGFLLFIVAPTTEAITRDEVLQMRQQRKTNRVKVPVTRIRSGKTRFLPIRFVQRMPRLFEYVTGTLVIRVTGLTFERSVVPLSNVQFILNLGTYSYPYPIFFSDIVAYSDENGEVIFSDLLPGEYTVFADAAGYAESIREIFLVKEQESSLGEFYFTQFFTPPTQQSAQQPIQHSGSAGGASSSSYVSPSPSPTNSPSPTPTSRGGIRVVIVGGVGNTPMPSATPTPTPGNGAESSNTVTFIPSSPSPSPSVGGDVTIDTSSVQ